MKKTFTILELATLINETDFDIGDNTYDLVNNFYFEEKFKNSEDYLEKFIYYIAEHTKVIKLFAKDSYMVVDLTGFINNHKRIFKKFFNEKNRKGYRPKDYTKEEIEGEYFYEGYLLGLVSLINGNYSDNDYKELYEELIK